MTAPDMRDVPVLKESRTEYLLYVPYALRHQARRVEGRRWDSSRKCWAFPKTARALSNLRLEFGDALTVEVGSPKRHRYVRWLFSSCRPWIGLAMVLAAVASIWVLRR